MKISGKIRLCGLIWSVLLLPSMQMTLLAQECCCDSGGQPSVVTEIEGCIPSSVVVVVKNDGDTTLVTREIEPGGNGIVSGSVQIPLSDGERPVSVEFPDGGANPGLGFRLPPGYLIWRNDGTETVDDARIRDWVSMEDGGGGGNKWWVKRRYPFAPPSGQLGQFEHSLPMVVPPDYVDYSSQANTPASVYWKLSLGTGAIIELNEVLESGSTAHEKENLNLIPHTAAQSLTQPISGSGTRLVSKDGNGNVLYAADVDVVGSNDTRIEIYQSINVLPATPYTTSGAPVATFTLEDFLSSSHEYGLRITKLSGGATHVTEIHGSSSSGADTKIEHDTGTDNNTRVETINIGVTPTERTTSRVVTENPGSITISSVSETHRS